MGWRQLTNDELFELDQEVTGRLEELRSRGVQFGGIDTHYLQTLLEEQLSENALAAAREKHLLWLKEKLEEAESQIRRATFLQGLGNGHG